MSDAITHLETKCDTQEEISKEDDCGQCSDMQQLKKDIDNIMRFDASGK